ncbi:PH domain-containing protein [Macrococcus bovicus]|uniref:PH domain-containing protein n=1 Tax=Macrococcus bovicus TaxID=69968 RepID=UPI0025A51CED|nr:PH domain-containing protein [Macrococcus bovicus]WJP97559.1 PH domain-containing protein [Macrococcus bovicus]
MSEPKRLHPITYLSKIFKSVKDNVLTVVLAGFLFLKNGFNLNDIGDLIFPGILLIFAVVSIVLGIIEALTTTYWISDDKLFVKNGILSVSTKEFYIARIQSVETTRNIVNQLFGGVILDIKTPGDGVKLDSISKQAADELTHYLETRKNNLGDAVEEVHQASAFESYYRLQLKDIMLMSVTSGAMGTVLAVVFGLYSQVDEILHISDRLAPIQQEIGSSFSSIALLVMMALLLSYITGIFVTALKYFNYELTYDGERLRIRYGLFEVKERIVIVKQIQAVEEKKSFLRQWLGYTSFRVTITSDAALESEDENVLGQIEVLPFIKRKEGLAVMAQLVPDYYYNEVDRVIPRRSLRRYIQWHWLVIIIATALVQYYFFNQAWMIGIVLLILTFIAGWMRYRYSGYVIQDDQITVRETGLFASSIYHLKEDRLISIHVTDHYFLENARLASIVLRVSAGSLFTDASLKLVERTDAERIYDWFIEKEVRQYEES